ncbi:hypothetical protein BpHYR1_002671 [Brachionus plicatilis]|uniref:Uncharacterized protein n=1 Tax=Brachionus plicatilis TaxID=10195 RepID=A0A3M7SL21_BRAPC|nr:hypothetical protein BpHYR1_002671 [Brachionus plicatilis]
MLIIICKTNRAEQGHKSLAKKEKIVSGKGVGYKSRFACMMMHNAMGDDTLCSSYLPFYQSLDAWAIVLLTCPDEAVCKILKGFFTTFRFSHRLY